MRSAGWAQMPVQLTAFPFVLNESAGWMQAQPGWAVSSAGCSGLVRRTFAVPILKLTRPWFGYWPDRRKTMYSVTHFGTYTKTIRLWHTQVGFPRTNRVETEMIPLCGPVRNTRGAVPGRRKRRSPRPALNRRF